MKINIAVMYDSFISYQLEIIQYCLSAVKRMLSFVDRVLEKVIMMNGDDSLQLFNQTVSFSAVKRMMSLNFVDCVIVKLMMMNDDGSIHVCPNSKVIYFYLRRYKDSYDVVDRFCNGSYFHRNVSKHLNNCIRPVLIAFILFTTIQQMLSYIFHFIKD